MVSTIGIIGARINEEYPEFPGSGVSEVDRRGKT